MKFQIGDKVVPVSKSIYGGLEYSNNWDIAQMNGQGFLYVVDYDPEFDCHICSHNSEKKSGDFFLDSDLVPYEEAVAEPCDCEECCVEAVRPLEELQQETIVQLEDKVMELEQELKHVLFELECVAEIKEDVEELEKRNKQLREQRDKARADVEDLRKTNGYMEDNIHSLMNANEELEEQIEELKAQLQKANLELGRVGALRDKFEREAYYEKHKTAELKSIIHKAVDLV